MKKVCVLLSTYNGELYIKEQIDSIFSQSDVDVTLIIRDDGSTDHTIDVIRDLEKIYSIVLLLGENIGWQRSFGYLLKTALNYGQFDYFAFADQDDIWLHNKLISAIEQLSLYENSIALYGSQLICYDDNNGSETNLYENMEKAKKSLQSRYFLGVAPFGCSMVWNKELQKKYLEVQLELDVHHDVWMHVLARSFGSVIIDNNSYIKHRIHSNNAAGVEKKMLGRIKKFFKVYMNPSYLRPSEMMKCFVVKYGQDCLEEQYREFIVSMTKYRGDYKEKRALISSSYFKSLDRNMQYRIILFLLVNKL